MIPQNPAEFFAGAREGREDAAPVSGPRHARRAPREIGWTIAAAPSLAFFAVVVAVTLYGVWWAA